MYRHHIQVERTILAHHANPSIARIACSVSVHNVDQYPHYELPKRACRHTTTDPNKNNRWLWNSLPLLDHHRRNVSRPCRQDPATTYNARNAADIPSQEISDASGMDHHTSRRYRGHILPCPHSMYGTVHGILLFRRHLPHTDGSYVRLFRHRLHYTSGTLFDRLSYKSDSRKYWILPKYGIHIYWDLLGTFALHNRRSPFMPPLVPVCITHPCSACPHRCIYIRYKTR